MFGPYEYLDNTLMVITICTYIVPIRFEHEYYTHFVINGPNHINARQNKYFSNRFSLPSHEHTTHSPNTNLYE